MVEKVAKAMDAKGCSLMLSTPDRKLLLHWLVISTWADAERWKDWQNSAERKEIISMMEPLIVSPEKVSLFEFVRQ